MSDDKKRRWGYRQWLGLPESVKEPTVYQLLGISPFEADESVIRNAVEQRRSFILSKRGQGHDEIVTLLNREIEDATAIVLAPELRRQYNQEHGIRKSPVNRKAKQATGARSRFFELVRPHTSDYVQGSGLLPLFAGIMAVIVGGILLVLAAAWYFPSNQLARNPDKAKNAKSDFAAATAIESRAETPSLDTAHVEGGELNSATVSEMATKSGVVPKMGTPDSQERTAVAVVSTDEMDLDETPQVDPFDSKKTEDSVEATTKMPVQLIRGNSLDGWVPTPWEKQPQWDVSNGVLKRIGNGPSLATKDEFQDFDLHMEFSLPPKCNSGVFLRGKYEVQLLDSMYRSNSGKPAPPENQCGAIIGQIAPREVPYEGPNQWNTLDVRLVGRIVTVSMNGITIIENGRLQNPTNSAAENDQSNTGPIILQAHRGVGAMFRNITIKPLP